jgi:hypothetical protein
MMAARSVVVALLVAAAVCMASAEEDAGDIIELTGSTYDDSVCCRSNYKHQEITFLSYASMITC